LSGGVSGATSYRGRGPKNYTRSDERIREDLNERLTDSDEIDASNITVEVSNGVRDAQGQRRRTLDEALRRGSCGKLQRRTRRQQPDPGAGAGRKPGSVA
jgi:hypothetical protein